VVTPPREATCPPPRRSRRSSTASAANPRGPHTVASSSPTWLADRSDPREEFAAPREAADRTAGEPEFWGTGKEWAGVTGGSAGCTVLSALVNSSPDAAFDDRWLEPTARVALFFGLRCHRVSTPERSPFDQPVQPFRADKTEFSDQIGIISYRPPRPSKNARALYHGQTPRTFRRAPFFSLRPPVPPPSRRPVVYPVSGATEKAGRLGKPGYLSWPLFVQYGVSFFCPRWARGTSPVCGVSRPAVTFATPPPPPPLAPDNHFLPAPVWDAVTSKGIGNNGPFVRGVHHHIYFSPLGFSVPLNCVERREVTRLGKR